MIEIQDLALKEFSFGGTGEPLQRIAITHESPSGHLQQGIWESGPGEFTLSFEWDETVYVLGGGALVTNIRTGESFSLRPGSLSYFMKGSTWRWEIPREIRKVFTLVM